MALPGLTTMDSRSGTTRRRRRGVGPINDSGGSKLAKRGVVGSPEKTPAHRGAATGTYGLDYVPAVSRPRPSQIAALYGSGREGLGQSGGGAGLAAPRYAAGGGGGGAGISDAANPQAQFAAQQKQIVAERDTPGGIGRDGKRATGFASTYAPGWLSDVSATEAGYDVILDDTLNNMGQANNTGLQSLFEGKGGLYQLLELLQNGTKAGGGANGGQNSATDAELVNWINAKIKNDATPGGNILDPSQMLASILDSNPDSALGQILGGYGEGGVAESTAQTSGDIMNFINAATSGYAPLYQGAIQDRVSKMARELEREKSRGKNGYKGNLDDYIQANGSLF